MRNRLPLVRSEFSLNLFLRKNYTTILARWDETKTQLPDKIEKVVTKNGKVSTILLDLFENYIKLLEEDNDFVFR